jgi:hypothetical protein
MPNGVANINPIVRVVFLLPATLAMILPLLVSQSMHVLVEATRDVLFPQISYQKAESSSSQEKKRTLLKTTSNVLMIQGTQVVELQEEEAATTQSVVREREERLGTNTTTHPQPSFDLPPLGTLYS